jgi:hypothetical protein
MKVSSSPFEAPIGVVRPDSTKTDRTRIEGRDSELHPFRSPAAAKSVRAGLDSATKEALRQLAEQLDSEKEKERNTEREDHEDHHKKHHHKKDHQKEREKKQSGSQQMIQSQMLHESGAFLAACTGSRLVAITKLRLRFEKIRQKRGQEVYRQEARSRIIREVEIRLANSDEHLPAESFSAGVDFLPTDESNHLGPSAGPVGDEDLPIETGTKRVA